MLKRFFTLPDAATDSVLLFGARQTGKTTLLRELFPDAIVYDLLKTDVYERLSRHPERLREELVVADPSRIVVIDEVQRLPVLLNEVHWLIENRGMRFVMSGSSARKLKQSGVNSLGGRALVNRLFPFVSSEIPDFDVIRAVNNGMIPRHYLVANAWKRQQAYVCIYLQEEVKAESLVRSMPSFVRFLEVAALTNGEIVNYTNIASDCGVSANTVKEYFNILQDTLTGYFIPAYTKAAKRKVIQSPKFYFFDVGIANYLRNWRQLLPGSVDFGHAFEHLIIQELVAYSSYTESPRKLSYWRTANGWEVDAVLGDAEVAIEIKSVGEVRPSHAKGLKHFKLEYPEARTILVSLDTLPRLMDGVEVMPVTYFLKQLWQGLI